MVDGSLAHTNSIGNSTLHSLAIAAKLCSIGVGLILCDFTHIARALPLEKLIL